MTGAEFAEMIRAATIAAIRRTEARSARAAAHAWKELDDITQAAALDTLERIERGEDAPPAQLAARAANAAIVRAYRDAYDPRRVPEDAETDDGDRIPRADLQSAQDASRRPEEAAEAADELQRIYNAIPAAYRADAPRVISAAAAGYTAAETARALDCSPRRVERIRAAARAAAEEVITR